MLIGSYLAPPKNFAEVAAATMITLGFDPGSTRCRSRKLYCQKSHGCFRVALRQGLLDSNLKAESINLYTSDVHARRSWLIFKQILAPDVKVGIIAVASHSYDPKQWWAYSAGVRFVIDETIAYIYAWFINWGHEVSNTKIEYK